MKRNNIKFIIDNTNEMDLSRLKENILTSAYYGDLDSIKNAVSECPESVNFVDKFTGGSALHISAGLGNYSCVEFLVQCDGIDLFLKDHSGNEAIVRAFQIGHHAICDLLADKMYPNRGNAPDPLVPKI